MRLIPGLMLLLLITGCVGGRIEVRLQPPGVQVENIRLENGQIYLSLLLHNHNDHEILVETIHLRLEIEELDLLENEWTTMLGIDPRGRERIDLEAPDRSDASGRLVAATESEQRNVAYLLQAEMVLSGQRNGTIEQSGFLHPVPGQPGNFR